MLTHVTICNVCKRMLEDSKFSKTILKFAPKPVCLRCMADIERGEI